MKSGSTVFLARRPSARQKRPRHGGQKTSGYFFSGDADSGDAENFATQRRRCATDMSRMLADLPDQPQAMRGKAGAIPPVSWRPAVPDCRAAMLQAIRVGRPAPMLEPWIIDEILRREEERRREVLPRLEIPLPPASSEHGERGDLEEPETERGVAIIGI